MRISRLERSGFRRRISPISVTVGTPFGRGGKKSVVLNLWRIHVSRGESCCSGSTSFVLGFGKLLGDSGSDSGSVSHSDSGSDCGSGVFDFGLSSPFWNISSCSGADFGASVGSSPLLVTFASSTFEDVIGSEAVRGNRLMAVYLLLVKGK